MVDSSKKGVGIIGLGGFGLFLMREWSELDNIEIVAVSDENDDRNPNTPGITFYRNYKEMLKDPKVQIVSIATPPSTHLRMSLEAIEQGKHVLIEKPVALSVEDGKTISEAAKKAGVVATVNFVLRYDPLVEAVKNVVASGVFGKPRRVDLRNYATLDTVPAGHWFWNRDISGGIMIEHGVHFFDMTSYMLGAKAVDGTGTSVWQNHDQEDRVFGTVRFDGDVIGTYWHSFTRPAALETTNFHMDFDLGEIEISGWIPLSASFWGWTDEAGVEALKKYLPGVQLDVTANKPFDTQSCDTVYHVTSSVRGTAMLQDPKIRVYGNLVRAVMTDVVAAIDDPSHKLKVTLEDGIAAVAIAEKCTAPLPE